MKIKVGDLVKLNENRERYSSIIRGENRFHIVLKNDICLYIGKCHFLILNVGIIVEAKLGVFEGL